MSIFWSFQKFSDQVSELTLTDLYPLFGEKEKEVFQRLRFPKRRMDWLGARIVTKKLVQMADDRWKYKEIRDIEILNAESGAPYLNIHNSPEHPGSVSLSHSNGFVLCGYSPRNINLGVDLELIEPRSKAFAEDFFGDKELSQVASMDAEEQNLYTTLIWSGKEAVLKFLSTGLRVDPRSVEITIPQNSTSINGWGILGMTSDLIKTDSPHLVWRRENDFVLTACVPSGCVNELKQVDFYSVLSTGR
jgi:4'-phosphopantetheinyl transferase